MKRRALIGLSAVGAIGYVLLWPGAELMALLLGAWYIYLAWRSLLRSDGPSSFANLLLIALAALILLTIALSLSGNLAAPAPTWLQVGVTLAGAVGCLLLLRDPDAIGLTGVPIAAVAGLVFGYLALSLMAQPRTVPTGQVAQATTTPQTRSTPKPVQTVLLGPPAPKATPKPSATPTPTPAKAKPKPKKAKTKTKKAKPKRAKKPPRSKPRPKASKPKRPRATYTPPVPTATPRPAAPAPVYQAPAAPAQPRRPAAPKAKPRQSKPKEEFSATVPTGG